jgi:crotonobetainyl-CoA:carnitine CoA-transferase CaiB-like acyl-CoA transferase
MMNDEKNDARALPDEACRPLAGLRVLELAQVMAGPVTGLGAEVIKVEKMPGGDDTRSFNKRDNDVPPGFQILNRGKKSVALDLKHPDGRAVLERLVRDADVLTENFRPGTIEKLGIGPERLLTINPRLVICSITGYGRKGPLAGRGGFDLILQAYAGLISVTGEPDRPGVKPGVSLADVNAGILAALGVLAAYIRVLRTGRGQRVETSLLQASMQQLYWFAALFFSTGQNPGRLGTAHPMIAPYQTFRCADGELAIGGANEANWQRLVDVVGRPEWRDDARFKTTRSRLENREALAECINVALESQTRAYWEEKLNAAGIPAGPVQTVGEALLHPQSRAMDMVVDADTPDGGSSPMLGLPLHFDGGNRPAVTAAPRFGADTSQVLRDSGFSDAEIARLVEIGAVHQS